jgi:hypothetical protein
MSLINDALKKAQRSRTAGPADLSAPVPGGEVRIVRRGDPLTAKTILLYASSALVLFVLAVVGAVYFLNRPTPRPASEIQIAPGPPAAPAAGAVVTLPVAAAPIVPAAALTPAPAPAATAPAPGPAITVPDTAKAPLPEVAVTPPAVSHAAPPLPPPTPALPPAAPPAAAMADERVYLFLEGIRVSAVRILPDNESRVMMNDRVFRTNDIVDRNLSLRLSRVEPGQLIFTDARGIEYVKFY